MLESFLLKVWRGHCRENSLSALSFLNAGTLLLLATDGAPGSGMCWAKNFCQPPGLLMKSEIWAGPQFPDTCLNHFHCSKASPAPPALSTARGVCSQAGRDQTSRTPNPRRLGVRTRAAGGRGGGGGWGGGRGRLPPWEKSFPNVQP